MSDVPNKRPRIDTSTGVSDHAKVKDNSITESKVKYNVTRKPNNHLIRKEASSSNLPVKEECKRKSEKYDNRVENSRTGIELVQQRYSNEVVDTPFKNALNAFSPKIASAGRWSYVILREGLLRSSERLLDEFTSPPLTYKKGMVFNSGQKHSYSYKSPDGDTITAYAVIAEDVQTELITADVVDGGIGMKHIKVEVKNHQEGPWSYRVVIGGRKSSAL